MKQILIPLCLLFVGCTGSSGQLSLESSSTMVVKHPSTSLTGYVISENDLQYLVGANIEIVGQHLSSITDVNGKFEIYMPSGIYSIRVSYVGYEKIIIDSIIVPHKEQPLIIMQRWLDICHDADGQARRDLANGHVYLRSESPAIIFAPAEKQLNQLYKRYGFQRHPEPVSCLNLGDCDEKYDAIVKIYLTLRNGKDWWELYQSEKKRILDSFK